MKKKSNVKSLRICKIKKRPNEKCLHKIVQFFIDMKLCLETSKNSLLPALSPLPSLPPTQLPSCFTLHPLRRKKPSSYPPLHAPIPTPTPTLPKKVCIGFQCTTLQKHFTHSRQQCKGIHRSTTSPSPSTVSLTCFCNWMDLK